MSEGRPAAARALLLADLALLILWPLAWTAPLLRTGLLPFLPGEEVSVVSAVRRLWDSDPWLSALVGLLGVALPYAKTLGVAALHLGRIPARFGPSLSVLAKLSMADVFLVALVIVVAKGVGLGRVETAWGLPLFAACALASLLLSLPVPRRRAA